MEESRAHLKKYGKIIQVVLIVLQVFVIITMVIGGIMIVLPIFQPEVLNDIKVGFEDNDFFIVQLIFNMTEGSLDLGGIHLRRGENFFLPYELKKLPVRGQGKMILIRPPAA